LCYLEEWNSAGSRVPTLAAFYAASVESTPLSSRLERYFQRQVFVAEVQAEWRDQRFPFAHHDLVGC